MRGYFDTVFVRASVLIRSSKSWGGLHALILSSSDTISDQALKLVSGRKIMGVLMVSSNEISFDETTVDGVLSSCKINASYV